MLIGSHWPDFKFRIQNGFFRNVTLWLAGKGSGTLHFLCILALTGTILNLEYKRVFVAMVCFY